MHPIQIAVLKAVVSREASSHASADSPTEIAGSVADGIDSGEAYVESLVDRGFLRRDGNGVSATKSGKRVLYREYEEYRSTLGIGDTIELIGAVTSGLGEGERFVAMDEYRRQFRRKFDYDPYLGTFNVSLVDESAVKHAAFQELEPIEIEGWSDGDRSFGPVWGYPATVHTPEGHHHATAHVVIPERSAHKDDQIELVADVKLRDELDASDGDTVITNIRLD